MSRRSQEGGKAGGFIGSSRVPAFLFILLSPAASGCTTHQCDASSSTVDDSDAGFVSYGGTYVWQSSSYETGWIPFHGNETITFILPRGFPSTYSYGFQAGYEVSTGAEQTEAGGGELVTASGQLDEVQDVTPARIQVTNGNCADYYVRVVATAYATPPVDAGADAPHD